MTQRIGEGHEPKYQIGDLVYVRNNKTDVYEVVAIERNKGSLGFHRYHLRCGSGKTLKDVTQAYAADMEPAPKPEPVQELSLADDGPSPANPPEAPKTTAAEPYEREGYPDLPPGTLGSIGEFDERKLDDPNEYYLKIKNPTIFSLIVPEITSNSYSGVLTGVIYCGYLGSGFSMATEEINGFAVWVDIDGKKYLQKFYPGHPCAEGAGVREKAIEHAVKITLGLEVWSKN